MATPVGRKLTDVIKPGLRVFISAGASGIGRAIADMLILHGAKVHICDVSQDFLNDFKKQHPQHGATLADVSKEADVARLFKDISTSLGGLDALINNAGIAGPTKAVEEITSEEWRRCIDIDHGKRCLGHEQRPGRCACSEDRHTRDKQQSTLHLQSPCSARGDYRA